LVVLEHPADVIRAADSLVELGPEAGGCIVFEGPPSAGATTATGLVLAREIERVRGAGRGHGGVGEWGRVSSAATRSVRL
jgi:hypothetical protein